MRPPGASFRRLAAVAVTTMHQVQGHGRQHIADFADFRDALRLPVERELLIARLEEAQRCAQYARARELLSDLDAVEQRLARGHGPEASG